MDLLLFVHHCFFQDEMPVHSNLDVWVDTSNVCNYDTNKNIARAAFSIETFAFFKISYL